MYRFLSGFIVALMVFLPVVIFFLCRKRSDGKNTFNDKSRQLEELGRLTGELAHEIKNPLSTIKVNLKLTAEQLQGLNRDGPDVLSRVLRKMDVIQKETDRLQQILEGFLHYIGKSELQLAAHDINGLIDDVIDFYRPQCQSHSITVREVLYREPLVCRIDADMLKQVLLNLFINAQQAMADGGELMVKTEREGNEAVIRISDTGTGIAPDRLSHIFEAQFTCRSGGSGLGLATVKKIIEAHHGRLSVSSELGKGTLFTIALPVHM